MKSKFTLEVIGLLVTLVLIVLLMLPIYSNIGEAYPFYRDNILVIFIAVTFIRYIFLLKYHWVSYSKYIKVAFIFLPIPVFFFLVGAIYDFQAFHDEIGFVSLMDDLSFKTQKNLGTFIRSQMILFWTAAFLANFYMPMRMILSIWRNLHKGTH